MNEVDQAIKSLAFQIRRRRSVSLGKGTARVLLDRLLEVNPGVKAEIEAEIRRENEFMANVNVAGDHTSVQ